MKYRDLREFIHGLEGMGELRRVTAPVSPLLEVTALSDRVLRAGGPALLFEHPTGFSTPALTNLFGTTRRVGKYRRRAPFLPGRRPGSDAPRPLRGFLSPPGPSRRPRAVSRAR